MLTAFYFIQLATVTYLATGPAADCGAICPLLWVEERKEYLLYAHALETGTPGSEPARNDTHMYELPRYDMFSCESSTQMKFWSKDDDVESLFGGPNSKAPNFPTWQHTFTESTQAYSTRQSRANHGGIEFEEVRDLGLGGKFAYQRYNNRDYADDAEGEMIPPPDGVTLYPFWGGLTKDAWDEWIAWKKVRRFLRNTGAGVHLRRRGCIE